MKNFFIIIFLNFFLNKLSHVRDTKYTIINKIKLLEKDSKININSNYIFIYVFVFLRKSNLIRMIFVVDFIKIFQFVYIQL